MDPRRRTPISRRTLLGAGLALAGLPTIGSLAGCGSSGTSGAGTDTLRIAQVADTTTLDPQKQSGLTSMNILINIFDMLTNRDVDNKLVPGLATSWEPIGDLTWRFHLRQGVTFHNGEPFDAAAAKFSIDRLLAPATKSTIVELRYVTKTTVVDDHTIDLHTSSPDPVIPEKVSLFGGVMVPPRYLAQVGDAGFAAQPVGTGPYTFVRWRKDIQLELTANPGYWGGKPAVDNLVFMPMPNAASQLAALSSNGVDLVSGVTPEQGLQLAGYTGVSLQTFPGIRMSFLSLDTTDPLLSDVRIRRALNHATDVPQLIDAVLDNKAREAPTMIPRESFGFDPSIPTFDRSLDTARRLLTEAGHPDGIDLTLTASNADSLVAQAIAGLMGRAGIRVSVNLLDPGTFSQRLTSDNKKALGQMYLTASTGWTLDGSATMQSYVRSDRRQSRLSSPVADALVDRIESQIDPQRRQVAFTEMQQFLHDQAPFVFLYQINLLYATNGRASWRPNVIGTLAMNTATMPGGTQHA